MSRLDAVATALLLGMGCIHILLGVFVFHPRLDEPMLWFLAGGIMLCYLAALNWLRLRTRAAPPMLRTVVLAANAVGLAFALAFTLGTGNLDQPQGWVLIALLGWLTARSLLPQPA